MSGLGARCMSEMRLMRIMVELRDAVVSRACALFKLQIVVKPPVTGQSR